MDTLNSEDVIKGVRHPAPSSQFEVSALLHALQAVRDGDFDVQLPGDWTGIYGKVADTFNEIVRSNRQISGAKLPHENGILGLVSRLGNMKSLSA